MDARPDESPALLALREEAARLWHGGNPVEAARRYARAAAEAELPWQDLLRQGHALRATGDGAGALAAYTAAADDAPAEPLPQLHRGHALRLMGWAEEARRAYAIAAGLGPGDPAGAEAGEAARLMVEGRDPPPPPAPPPPAAPAGDARPAAAAPPAPEAPPSRGATRLAPPPRPRIALLRPGGRAAGGAVPAGGLAFDVTDLLLHFGGRRTLTGIQRVQASLVGAALRTGLEAAYVTYERPRAAWRALDPAALARLIDLAAAGSDTTDPAWAAARAAVPEHAPGVPAHAFAEGATLVNLGNSWGLGNYFRGLRAAQRASGLRYVPFLHDCVPLVMPEHCVRTLVQDYARWFAAMGLHASGVICNSACTRSDGRRFLDALIPGLDLPMEVVRLDADPRGLAAPDPSALAGTRAPRPPEPYVLFVATIESRKDHLTVLRAWLSLLRRHGPARVPRLVLVGAPGWHAEAATGLLEGSPELARHVVTLHGVSDGALAALYRDCLFTVYNSHYEGWGLPVTESLAWGKVPVVPRHSALLESGAGAAVYVDPQSEAALAAAVERLVLDPAALAEAERAVAALGPPRPWEAVLAEVVERVGAIAAREVPPAPGRVATPLGLTLRPRRGDSTRPDLPAALADAMLEGPGWGPAEDWGTPLSGGAARLRMPLPPGTAGLLRLYLEMRGTGGGTVRLLLLADSAPAGAAAVEAPPEGRFATAVPVEVAEGAGMLELEIEAPEGTGLLGAMLCRDDDLIARLDFLETQPLPHVRAD